MLTRRDILAYSGRALLAGPAMKLAVYGSAVGTLLLGIFPSTIRSTPGGSTDDAQPLPKQIARLVSAFRNPCRSGKWRRLQGSMSQPDAATLAARRSASCSATAGTKVSPARLPGLQSEPAGLKAADRARTAVPHGGPHAGAAVETR